MKTLWIIFLMMIFAGAMLFLGSFGCDDDDDDDDEKNAGDDDDADCGADELCGPMIDTGFIYDEQECIDWYANEGNDDCDDYETFLDCACNDCLPLGSLADFETCLGECVKKGGCFGA